MEVFRKSKMDTYYAGGIEYDWDCVVRIDSDMVVIEYDTAEGWCTYRGHPVGEGHFRLQAVGFKGDATLHRFPGGKVLEGFWIEEAEQGMWRIRLQEE